MWFCHPMSIRNLTRGAGGPKKVSQLLDCSMKRVSMWGTRDSVPARYAAEFGRITDTAPDVLRPDVFRAPAKRVAA